MSSSAATLKSVTKTSQETMNSPHILFSSKLKQTFSASLNQIITFPSDHRQYRYLVLDNGLKVFLVEDSKAQQSQAILDVCVGSHYESSKFLGLAHFLEHMLFLGSAKYPKAGEFQTFINSNAGSYNGQTFDEKTQYYFSIGHENFMAALDRMAQFFIAPLFNEDCIERELNAVNNEFLLKLETDGDRLAYLEYLRVNPTHPASRFTVGNLDTLKQGSNEELIKAVKDFYKQYYIANNMILYLESNKSLKEIEEYAKNYFSTIPKGSQATPKLVKPLLYTSQELGHHIQLKSIEESQQLSVEFYVNINRTIANEQACFYLSYIMNGNHEGSYFNFLKTKAWADLFRIHFDWYYDKQIRVTFIYVLTNLGILKQEELLEGTFSFVKFIKQQGIQSKYFEELKNITRRTMQFFAYSINTGGNFIDHLKRYPLAQAFTGSMIMDLNLFPKNNIRNILNGLTSENMNTIFLYKNVKTNKIEPYTTAEYSIEKRTLPKTISSKEWSEVRFKLPIENSYIPENFNVSPVYYKTKTPALIHSEDRLRIWHSFDYEFKKPLIKNRCFFITNLTRNTIYHSLYSILIEILLEEDAQKKLGKQFESALVTLDFNIVERGIKITVISFSDKHSLVFLRVMEDISKFIIEDSRFNAVKELVTNVLRRKLTEQPKIQLRNKMEEILNQYDYSAQEMLSILDETNIADCRKHYQQLFSSSSLEFYMHGNISIVDSTRLAQKAFGLFSKQFSSAERPKGLLVNLEAGSKQYYLIKTDLSNNVMNILFQPSRIDLKTSCMLQLIACMLHPKYFEQLRTREQLAYDISCTPCTLEHSTNLLFAIDSASYSASYLIQRTELFINNVVKFLNEYSLKDFDAIKLSIINNIEATLNTPTAFQSFPDLFSYKFNLGIYRFHSIYTVPNIYKQFSLAEVISFCKQLFGTQTRKQLIVKTFDANDEVRFLNATVTQSELLSALTITKLTQHFSTQNAVLLYIGEPEREEGVLIKDINTFKQQAKYFPDYMLQGENDLQKSLTTAIKKFKNHIDVTTKEVDERVNTLNQIDKNNENTNKKAKVNNIASMDDLILYQFTKPQNTIDVVVKSSKPAHK